MHHASTLISPRSPSRSNQVQLLAWPFKIDVECHCILLCTFLDAMESVLYFCIRVTCGKSQYCTRLLRALLMHAHCCSMMHRCAFESCSLMLSGNATTQLWTHTLLQEPNDMALSLLATEPSVCLSTCKVSAPLIALKSTLLFRKVRVHGCTL